MNANVTCEDLHHQVVRLKEFIRRTSLCQRCPTDPDVVQELHTIIQIFENEISRRQPPKPRGYSKMT